LWIMNLVENLAETFALSEANGLDPALFLDAITGRPMDSGYAHLKGEKILNEDYSPVFSLSLAAKDVRLALAMAKDAGIELGLGLVSVFLLPSYVGKLYQEDGQRAPTSGWSGFWAFFPYVGTFVWRAKTQGALNDFWTEKGAPKN